MWGWKAQGGLIHSDLLGSPTRVGMEGSTPGRDDELRREPHACGDGRQTGSRRRASPLGAPRVWGWKVIRSMARSTATGSPTRVGMEGSQRRLGCAGCREPHACGDGRMLATQMAITSPGAPRVWGWKDRPLSVRCRPDGSPTRVGMEANRCSPPTCARREPHACGDGRAHGARRRDLQQGAPRVWGWKARLNEVLSRQDGSPTRVGMEGEYRSNSSVSMGEPHACGDGRSIVRRTASRALGAPRVWGWKDAGHANGDHVAGSPTRVGMEGRTVRVGVICSREPHACGDGRILRQAKRDGLLGAPRVWGWKVERHRAAQRAVGSPTRAGMEGRSGSAATPTAGEPHACGDGRQARRP